MVLVKNICISTSISNTTQIRPQHFRNLSAVGVTGCICVVLDMLVLIKKFGTSTTHTQWTHMKFPKCCGHICVVLDMLVLIQYLALTPRTFPVDTHEVSEVLWAYECSVGYTGANKNVRH